MKKLFLLVAVIAFAGSARAADWPMWGGTMHRNMVNATEKNIAADWDVEKGTNVKWHVELGSQSYGNVVIAGGKVFAGTNNGATKDPKIEGDKGVVMCFRESDGEFLWQAVHDKLESGRVNDWPEQGVCSSPLVEGGKIYYVTNRCTVVCADVEGFGDNNENDGPKKDEKLSGPKDADFIWEYDMVTELGVFPHNMAACSPVIMGDKIFIVTANGVDEGHVFIPSPKAPSFICLDKNKGTLIWESAAPGKGILHGQWSNATCAVVNGKEQVYFPGGDGWIYAYDTAKGELIWKFDCNPKDAVYVLGGRGTRNEIIGTPVFVDNVLYVGVGQDPEHGEGPGHFYAIDCTKTGDVTESGKIWHYKKINRSISTAAVHGGLVYISDLSGFLYCLDQKTGDEVWQHDVLAAVWGSPTVIDGKVMLGDEDGDVVVLAAGREKKVLGEFNLGNAAYSTPVAANGVLYLMTRNEIYAVAPGAKK